MPQLIDLSDSSYGPGAMALGGMMNSFASNPKTEAEAMLLAARVREANQQQQLLAEQMKKATQDREFAAQDRSLRQNTEDAAGRYWGTQPRAPVPVTINGETQQPTADQMNRYYGAQNYFDQMARSMVRAGQSASDVAGGMTAFQKAYENANPAPAPATLADGTAIPPIPAGLSPDARQHAEQAQGTGVANANAGIMQDRAAAAKKLPELLELRDLYGNVDANGGIGTFVGNEYLGRPIGKFFHTDAEEARQIYDKQRQRVISAGGEHKGEGTVSNYERKLYEMPYAAVNDMNAKVGRSAMGNQFSYTLRTLGVPDTVADPLGTLIANGAPREAVDHLIAELQRGNTAAAVQFLDAASRGGR